MRPLSQRMSILILLAVAVGCEGPEAPWSCDPDNTLQAYSPFTMTRKICFEDPNGDVLTYDVAVSDPALADIALFGTTLTVTGKEEGETEITVTAMDPGGRIGTATYDLTVTPAWNGWFSVCDRWRRDGGVETAIRRWIMANVDLDDVRSVLYVNGERRGVYRTNGLPRGHQVRIGSGEFGPGEDIDIECSQVITAQLVRSEL